MGKTHIAALLGLLALTFTGCTGSVGGPTGGGGGPAGGGGPGDPPLACDLGIPQAGEERIYRLTPAEYTNSVRALLADEDLSPSIDSDAEPIASLVGVRKWYDAADVMVPNSTGWMGNYVSCDLAGEAGCPESFYFAFAERAFRRPLLADEKAWLGEAWAAMPADADQTTRLKTMAELILQAPQFLYLYAEGTALTDKPDGLRALTGYERAQRLSYFLWDTLPDDELLRAAGAGELDDATGMRDQAERMLADDRAKPVLREFLSDWLELNGGQILPRLDETPKDGELFPAFDAGIRAAMRKELEAFMDYVMFEKDGSLDALFTDTRAYVNGPLADLYGVTDGPADANTWAWVDLDAEERAGVLTRAGFLAVHGAQTATSPIRRGVYVLRDVLCYSLGAPPANVDNTPVKVTDLGEDGVESVRDATIRRTSAPACATCHADINAIGFAFEHYNSIGAWQETETGTGATIDTSSTLRHAGDEVDGPVADAVELSERLAMSPAVATCATERWFEVALRRSPVPLDACAVEGIRDAVVDTGSIRELLLTMVSSNAFLNVNHGPGQTVGGN